jgi:cyclic-di-GMP-binding protein
MPSFDIVSKTPIDEVDNALQGVTREIAQRFDFKGSKCSIERKDNDLTVLADDDMKLQQVHELLKVYLTRRKLEASALDFQTPEKASGNSVRQKIVIKQGIEQDIAKQISKFIKDHKYKVQVSIQGDELRVTGKKRDDLQEAIQGIKAMEVNQPLQFINFRE